MWIKHVSIKLFNLKFFEYLLKLHEATFCDELKIVIITLFQILKSGSDKKFCYKPLLNKLNGDDILY